MSHTIRSYPASRVATFDVGKIGSKKHHIYGLLEVDVTLGRQKIKENLRRGEDTGLIAWLIKVISSVIAMDPQIQALNIKGGKQVLFENVDVSFPMEKEVQGMKVPLAALIREANLKTVSQIAREIQVTAEKEVRSGEDFVLTGNSLKKGSALFFHMPQWIRMLIWRFIFSNPFRIKENMGTVVVTNMGMTGQVPGWIVPTSLHNLSFAVGSVVKKPRAVNNEIQIRDVLHLTILIDHDAVDGGPAARFTDKLVTSLQRADYL